jgi:hypothetical protein
MRLVDYLYSATCVAIGGWNLYSNPTRTIASFAFGLFSGLWSGHMCVNDIVKWQSQIDAKALPAGVLMNAMGLPHGPEKTAHIHQVHQHAIRDIEARFANKSPETQRDNAIALLSTFSIPPGLLTTMLQVTAMWTRWVTNTQGYKTLLPSVQENLGQLDMLAGCLASSSLGFNVGVGLYKLRWEHFLKKA